MSLRFTQEEVESDFSDILKHGSRTDIARISGLAEATIKRQFNPNDPEAASCVFRTLQMGCAADDIDEQMGEAFWQALLRFRELSKKPKSSSPSCLNLETGKLNKEITDFVNAKLADQPFEIQMKELLEARRQLDRVQDELIAEYNRLKETPRNLRRVR